MNQLILSSGNSIVDAVAKINFTGNIIPENWYKTLLRPTTKKPYLIAIIILADIVYWYRPSEKRDETTHEVSWSRKFRDKDYLQKSYDELSDHFGISKDQTKAAIIYLENKGVIKRHFRTIVSCGIRLNNVLYIELIPNVLFELTYPEGIATPVCKNTDTPAKNVREDSNIEKTGPLEISDTNTKNTTYNSTEDTTTASDDVDFDLKQFVNELFCCLSPSAQEVDAIIKAANRDKDKMIKAKKVMDAQKATLHNPIGWLIQCINNEYSVPQKYRTAAGANKTLTQNYDFAALEAEMMQ